MRSRHDIEDNEFEMITVLQWEIYPEDWDENLTLELDASVEGLSEDVNSIILVHHEGDEG